MTKKCEECGSYDLKVDNIRGEVVCSDCGLVIEDQASAAQNDNAGAMWGENASNTPTKDEAKIKTGSKGNALGSYIGKPNEAKGKWKILRHLHARDVKDLHPMAQAEARVCGWEQRHTRAKQDCCGRCHIRRRRA